MSPSRPQGMHADVWIRIGRLPVDKRDRVLERAAILIAEGIPAALADERALAEEAGIATQKELVR